MMKQTDIPTTTPLLKMSGEHQQAVVAKAVSNLNLLIPMMTSFTAALTGDNMRLRVTAESSATDGKTIWLRPPVRLGLPDGHAEAIGLDEAMTVLCHEIAHVTYNSFAKVSPTERRKVIQEEAADIAALADHVKMASRTAKLTGSWMAVAQALHPVLPTLVNALEDSRVNDRIGTAREGVRVALREMNSEILTKGMEVATEDGSVATVLMTDRGLELQVCLHMYLFASGFDADDLAPYFSPEAAAIALDEEIVTSLQQATTFKSAREVFRASVRILGRLNEMGHFLFDPPELDPAEASMIDMFQHETRIFRQDRWSYAETAQNVAIHFSTHRASRSSRAVAKHASDLEDSLKFCNRWLRAKSTAAEWPGDRAFHEGMRDAIARALADEFVHEDLDVEPEIQHLHKTLRARVTELLDLYFGDDYPRSDEAKGEGAGEGGQSDDQSDDDQTDQSDQSGDDDQTDDDGQSGQTDAQSGDQSGDGDDQSDADDQSDDDGQSGDDGQGGDDNANQSDDDPGVKPDEAGGSDDGSNGSEEITSSEDSKSEDNSKPASRVDPFELAEDFKRTLSEASGHDMDPEHDDPWSGDGENDAEQELVAAVASRGFLGATAETAVGNFRVIEDGDSDLGGSWYGCRTWSDVDRITQERALAYTGNPMVVGRVGAGIRRILQANKRTKHERGLKRGSRFDRRNLATRIPTGGDDIFTARKLPEAKSYHFIVAIDASGSMGETLRNFDVPKIETARHICANLGDMFSSLPDVSFEIVFHTGDSIGTLDGSITDARRKAVARVFTGSRYELVARWVKTADEQWGLQSRKRIAAIDASAGNLDGHAMRMCRILAERQSCTKKIILYVTDGEFPAMNSMEEGRIISEELDTIKRDPSIEMIGLGIGTDSPKSVGLDTLAVHTDADLLQLANFVGKYIR